MLSLFYSSDVFFLLITPLFSFLSLHYPFLQYFIHSLFSCYSPSQIAYLSLLFRILLFPPFSQPKYILIHGHFPFLFLSSSDIIFFSLWVLISSKYIPILSTILLFHIYFFSSQIPACVCLWQKRNSFDHTISGLLFIFMQLFS